MLSQYALITIIYSLTPTRKHVFKLRQVFGKLRKLVSNRGRSSGNSESLFLNRGRSSGSSDSLFQTVAGLREVPKACFKPWQVFGKLRKLVSNRGRSSGSSESLFLNRGSVSGSSACFQSVTG